MNNQTCKMYKTMIDTTYYRGCDDSITIDDLKAINRVIDLTPISCIDIDEAIELQDIINNYIRQLENDIKAINK